MEKRDYNAPTLENIFKLVKEMHNKQCPWVSCPKCGEMMKDTGFECCYKCSQIGKEDKTEEIPF